MIVLYASPSVPAFLKYRREHRTMAPEAGVHNVALLQSMKGWERADAYYVKGKHYDKLDGRAQRYLEANYREYVANS